MLSTVMRVPSHTLRAALRTTGLSMAVVDGACTEVFKADEVAAAMQVGVLMAAVALSGGINANLWQRRVRDSEMRAMPAPQMAAAQSEAVPPLP